MEIIEKIIEILKKIFFINDEKESEKKYAYSYKNKEYILTPTELKFYKILKEIADESNLIICPQVSLYEIIKSNDYKSFNKISRKSIDFVVAEQNLKIVYCIELDDYTHNKQSRIQRDNFVNEIFKQANIKLYHIPVKQYYNKDEIKKALAAT